MYSLRAEPRTSLNGMGGWLDDAIAAGVRYAEEWAYEASGGRSAATPALAVPIKLPEISVPVPQPQPAPAPAYTPTRTSYALVLGGAALLALALLARGRKRR
jgi:MYXO-CTERM domain-containing protein